MNQDLKPIKLVSPLTLESEFSIFDGVLDHLTCNNSGTVSCGKPGRLEE